MAELPLRLGLGVMPGDVVAFTGGGGKTSLCRVLSAELSRMRPALRVVYTTTAKMGIAPDMPLVLRDAAGSAWADRLAAELRRLSDGGVPPAVCAAGGLRADGKLLALSPAEVEALRRIADVVVVEADGSAGRPLKAPASHEPAIPPCATLVCPVAGLDAIGRRLDDGSAHRLGEVARVGGVAPGDVIDAGLVARVLAHPDGPARGASRAARVVPVLNKADLPGAPAAAAQAAADLARNGVRRVAITAAGAYLAGRARAPVFSSSGPVIGVLLAAGAARRFGGGKLLARLGGQPLVRHAAAALCAAGLGGLVAVIGPAEGAAVRDALAHLPLLQVNNPDAERGLSTSVRAAVCVAMRWAEPAPRALLFLPADQPLIGRDAIDRVVRAYLAEGAPIVAARCGGRPVAPNLFDRRLWPDLARLSGDVGGRALIDRHPERVRWVDFDDAVPFLDVDEPRDLARAERLLASSRHAPSSREPVEVGRP